MDNEMPGSTIGEITIIGTGGGYGESIVIHLGNNDWAVVDSCVDPYTKECLPLTYLRSIGVDVRNDVKIIICTHWHDDHLQGISKLYEEASEAFFCWTEASDKKKFLQLVGLDYQKIHREASNSSTVEFGNCLNILTKRNKKRFAQENTVLHSTKVNDKIRSEIISLSPSSQTIVKFQEEISTLIENYGAANKKIIKASPNAKSIALLIKLGSHRAILGADLEVGSEKLEGWINVLDNHTVIDKRSTLFKVAHHGSENGYSKRVWDELLENNPVAGLTPWNRNGKLPELEMLERYCNHSDYVYMTSLVYNEKPKKRDKSIEKLLKTLKCNISEVKYKQGLIRCRVNLESEVGSWCVEVIDHAFHVNN